MGRHAKLPAVLREEERFRGSVLVSLALFAGCALFAAGCAPRARMCTASGECGGRGACIAGRCQLEKATLKPAIDSARRLVVHPVDIGFTSSAESAHGAGGSLPAVLALGRDSTRLLLRFALTLPAGINVVEAYVVLRRATVVDDDPRASAFRAARIVEPWTGGAIPWGRAPRLVDARLPVTTVEPGTSPLVRVDVRDVVRGWARRDPADQGLAIVAEGAGGTGTTIALTGSGLESEGVSRLSLASSAADPEPYLEVYVR